MSPHQLLVLLCATVAFCFSFHCLPPRYCIYGYIKRAKRDVGQIRNPIKLLLDEFDDLGALRKIMLLPVSALHKGDQHF